MKFTVRIDGGGGALVARLVAAANAKLARQLKRRIRRRRATVAVPTPTHATRRPKFSMPRRKIRP